MTDPSTIPPDVAAKILAARDALGGAKPNIDEAWHQLYSITDPSFSSYTPWATLERRAAEVTTPDEQIQPSP